MQLTACLARHVAQRPPGAPLLPAVRSFLADVSFTDPGGQEGGQGMAPVKLMTLHASKGLEFDVVFMVGVNEGTLPSWHALRDGKVDDERRLCYVGFTRARERLLLSHLARDARWQRPAQPSRFLDEARLLGAPPP
jgi:superfamily I DNA/RNA helicase